MLGDADPSVEPRLRIRGHGASILELAYAPYGSYLATASGTIDDEAPWDNGIRFWDPTTGDEADSATVIVQSADLVVEKSVDNPAPNEADTLRYRMMSGESRALWPAGGSTFTAGPGWSGREPVEVTVGVHIKPTCPDGTSRFHNAVGECDIRKNTVVVL